MYFSRLALPTKLRGGTKPKEEENASNIQDAVINDHVKDINLDNEEGFHKLVKYVNYLRKERIMKPFDFHPQPQKYNEPGNERSGYTNDYNWWFGNYEMWMRGFMDWAQWKGDQVNSLYMKIKEALEIYGLHVTLHMDDLPGTNEELISGKEEEFWSNERFQLFKVHVKPAEHWLTFSASTFPDHGHIKDEFHISLCYMHELQKWYEQMKSKNGTDQANSSLCLWLDSYRTMVSKYNSKEAYLTGPVTKGGTVQLSTRTRVVGNTGDDNQLYDGGQPNPETGIHTDPGDPAVRLVHRFLNYDYDRSRGDPKSQQALHVSLLMTDEPPQDA
jgi:hypothetical protein